MPMITYLTRIRFDFGAVTALGEEVTGLGVTRPLIVTDPGIAAGAVLEAVLDALPAAMPRLVFDETPANPTEAAARDALHRYRGEGADGLIAVGGGSALDLAKAVRLMVTHPGPLARYAAIEGGVARITDAMPPMIAIPTTAGTGSEVGRGSLMIVDDGRKLGLISPHLIPSLALVDPDLTVGMPAWLTAGTGMDAVTHCIETFIAPSVNPPAEAIALDGLRRGWRAIRRATEHGHDREARWQMAMAAMMGAMAFQKGLGAVHGLSHPLGTLEGGRFHHGTLNAVLLPAVLRHNRPSCPEKYEALAAAMGGAEPTRLDRVIDGLNADLGLPGSLGAMGVPADPFDRVAEQAMADHSTASNPRPMTVESYRALLAEAA